MRSIFLHLCFDRKPQISRIGVELFVASNNLIVLNYKKVVRHFFEFKPRDKKIIIKKDMELCFCMQVLFGADDLRGAKTKSCS